MRQCVSNEKKANRKRKKERKSYECYLSLSESEGGGQFGPFGQRQVLCALEAAVELLQLQRRIDGARFAHLLALAVDPDSRF